MDWLIIVVRYDFLQLQNRSRRWSRRDSYGCRLIEAFLEIADDTNDFFKLRHVAEKHFATHGLVILPPGSQLVVRRDEPERTGTKGGVINPRPAEENFPVRGDAFEQAGISHRLGGNAFVNEAPEVVVMPGKTRFAGLVRRTKIFLVDERGLFPESAARRDCTDGKCVRAENCGKASAR